MTDDSLQAPPATAWTPGPWQWFGSTKHGEPYLATVSGGRVFVLQAHAEVVSCTNCDEWDDEDGEHTRNPDCECANARGALRFQSSDNWMTDAHVYAQYEVIRGQTAASDDRRLYRHDYQGFDHPDAKLIALAPEMAEAILLVCSEADRNDGTASDEAVAALHNAADKLRAIGERA